VGREDLTVGFTSPARVQILSESFTVNPPMTENEGRRTETRVYEISVPYADTFTVNAEIVYNLSGGSPGPTRSESATSPSGGAGCSADNSMGASCNRGEVKSSVNYGSGDYFDSVPLVRIPSPGPSIDLTLYYNSIDSAASPLGRGWRHSYMTSVSPPSGGMMTYTEEDGRRIVFAESTPPGTYLPRPQYGRNGSVLRRYTDNTSTLTRPDGTIYSFDSAGRLSLITDRRNKSLTVSLSGTNTLVTDSFGRTVRLVHEASGKLLKAVDPVNNETTMLYDLPTGTRFIGIRDAAGRVRSWSYDLSSRIASRTDVDNTTYWYFHDTSGRLDNVVDASGTVVAKMTYSPGDNTVDHLRADGGVVTTQYDPLLDMPVRVVDPLDNVTTYEYFPDRNLKKVILPGENGGTRETSYTYDANGYKQTMTDASGNTTYYRYNAYGQLEWVKDPDLRETSWSYDAATGNLLTVTAPDNAVTTYRYEDPVNPWKLTSIVRPGPNGPATTTFGYDGWGNVTSVSDPVGDNTSFTYDALGNVFSRTDPAGGMISFTYDNISRLKTVTDALGRLSRYGYDDATGFVTFTDNVGNVSRTQLDAKGNAHYAEDALGNGTWYEYTYGGCTSCGSNGTGELLYSVTDMKGQATFFGYDANGKRTTTTDPLWHTTSIAYHPSGDVRHHTDALLRQTSYGHDPLGNLARITDGRGGVTGFSYTSGGLLDNVVDANGNLTHYGYDAAGRVSQVASPDAGTSGYGYFSEGSVHTRTDAKNVTATYSYDDASRLTGISYPDASRNVTFAYDNLSVSYGKGRLTNMTDPSGTTAYRYDAMGRIVQEDRTVLGVSYTTGYGYDDAGNLATLTYPGGRVVTTSPNGIRRPTSISTVVNGLPASLAYAFTYDNVADRRSMTLGNGIGETSDFDAVHRPTAIAWGGLAGLSLGYDNVGNVASLADNTSSAVPSLFWWTTYDHVGNRLDNVTDTALRHYLYDENGNTTDDGLRTFIYEQGQRLLQVRQGATVLVENEYDGKGRRVIKRANNGATVTVFHYDLSDRLIAETDPSGTLKVEYVYLEGRPLAQIRHTGSSEAAYYYHDDHLGTPKMMTNGTGTVVWRVETDPFGNEIGTPVKTVENNLRFPGQYRDEETGLHQNYFRDYDPKTGRYVQADPIGLRGGMNLYPYAENSPVNKIDPLGLTTWPTDYPTVISPFGPRRGGFHSGIDIRNPLDDPAYATETGKVIKVWTDDRGGNQILILNDDGSISGYAHTASIVTPGETVQEGEIVGYSDESGKVSGPHLHYTFRACPTCPKIDPMEQLKKAKRPSPCK
jgi:RHS repeat-associated protein